MMPAKHLPPPTAAKSRRRDLFHFLHLITPLFCFLSYRYGLRSSRPSDQIIAEVIFPIPLVRTHLRTLTNVTTLNGNLRDSILSDHSLFASTQANTENLNDDFFSAQSNPSPPPLSHRRLTEYRLVKNAVRASAKRLLAKLSVTGPLKLDVQGWATVHANGSTHEPHTHEGALLAAVYYIAVPEEAGVLRLFDPREGGGVVEVRPGEGEMIMFPAWLLHEVGEGSGVRISLAFNVLSDSEEEAEFRMERIGLGRWAEDGKEEL